MRRSVMFISFFICILLGGCETNEIAQPHNVPENTPIVSTEPLPITGNPTEPTVLTMDSIPYRIWYQGRWKLVEGLDTYARYASDKQEILLIHYTPLNMKELKDPAIKQAYAEQDVKNEGLQNQKKLEVPSNTVGYPLVKYTGLKELDGSSFHAIYTCVFTDTGILQLIYGTTGDAQSSWANENRTDGLVKISPISKEPTGSTLLAIDSIPYRISYKGEWELVDQFDQHARYSSFSHEIINFNYTAINTKNLKDEASRQSYAEQELKIEHLKNQQRMEVVHNPTEYPIVQYTGVKEFEGAQLRSLYTYIFADTGVILVMHSLMEDVELSFENENMRKGIVEILPAAK